MEAREMKSTKKTIKKRNLAVFQREPRPSVCVVCGDPPIGYNYGAASCAPCKAFFRRIVVHKQLFSCCQRKGICEREPSLKPCRKCRYDKCISGGMKPELVAFIEISEPALLKGCCINDAPSSSTANESRRSKNSPEKVSLEYQTDELDVAPCDPTPSTSRQDDTRNLAWREAAQRKLRKSTYTPRLTPKLSIDDFAFTPSKLGCDFEQMYSPVFDPFSDMLFPPEMLIKNRAVLDLTDFDYTRKLWVIQDIIYTIEFMKALPIYQLLDDSSKRVLAASALACTNLMMAYYSYTQNSDRTLLPDGSVVTWTTEIQAQAPGATRFHTGIIAAFREVNIDEREYSLLKNILICNPNLDDLQQYDATLMQHEQERYTKTLLSYVLATRGVYEGPARFAKIISIADVANKLTSWQKAQTQRDVTSIALGLLKPSNPFRDSAQFITSFALGLAKPRNPFSEAVFHSH
ncbi:hypothetical protein PRIPAC_81382 [Pristionchus pacificus]|uniref:Nuclear receptor n=1 Tax=Pristionchus pacificus TaxID=54126 RepID=A0A2A6CNZ3_PRIPA|nr:hypothetical protein PRIPAC_81382 [Pristionchus pacificus]|eukprot:PDM79773.1 nuclear receptor [Pristionchus pacificus]